MIDKSRIIFEYGKLNYQNGLIFYFEGNGRIISFYIDDVPGRKRKIKVKMQPDPCHRKAHIHLDDHGLHDASFAIDTGTMMKGDCDAATQRVVKDWILRNKEDLQELWDIAKRGHPYRKVIKRIRQNRQFEGYGFKVKEPHNKEVYDGVIVWSDEKPASEYVDGVLKKITCDGDMYVGLPREFKDRSIEFESKNGKVFKKKW